MADTAIAITAGAGTNVDTRTEATNGNHRQVIVIGDPSTNAGVAPVDAIAGLKVDLGADNDVTITSTVIPTGAGTVGDIRKVVAVAGTAEQLAAQACKYLYIIAETDNTGIISLGTSTTLAAEGSQRGIILYAGQSTGKIEISNTNLLYVNSTVNGDGISYAYFN